MNKRDRCGRLHHKHRVVEHPRADADLTVLTIVLMRTRVRIHAPARTPSRACNAHECATRSGDILGAVVKGRYVYISGGWDGATEKFTNKVTRNCFLRTTRSPVHAAHA